MRYFVTIWGKDPGAIQGEGANPRLDSAPFLNLPVTP